MIRYAINLITDDATVRSIAKILFFGLIMSISGSIIGFFGWVFYYSYGIESIFWTTALAGAFWNFIVTFFLLFLVKSKK